MKNIKKTVLVLAVCTSIIVLLFYRSEIIDFFKIDSCLDQGGKWNYQISSCEK